MPNKIPKTNNIAENILINTFSFLKTLFKMLISYPPFIQLMSKSLFYSFILNISFGESFFANDEALCHQLLIKFIIDSI